MKLIIDTDPGIDDAMAIFYAHAEPQIELLGLTTVFGNVYVEQATRNALYLTDMLGIDIPVAQGAHKPLNGQNYTPSHHVHGPEGFGDFTEIPDGFSAAPKDAVDFLIEMARKHRGELVVSAIGPLTNIAHAIRKDPGFVENVAKIVIMGGAIDCPGNITPFAEANIYLDPHAADVVMASGARITLVGLDVTSQTSCNSADFARIARAAPKTGGFLNDISRFYLDFYLTVSGKDACNLHDPAAVIACIRPDLFDVQSMPVEVNLVGDQLGRTRRSGNPHRASIEVCMDVEAKKLVDVFLDRVSRNR